MVCHLDLSRYRETVIEVLTGLMRDLTARRSPMLPSPFTTSHVNSPIKNVHRQMVIGASARQRPAAIGENRTVVQRPWAVTP